MTPRLRLQRTTATWRWRSRRHGHALERGLAFVHGQPPHLPLVSPCLSLPSELGLLLGRSQRRSCCWQAGSYVWPLGLHVNVGAASGAATHNLRHCWIAMKPNKSRVADCPRGNDSLHPCAFPPVPESEALCVRGPAGPACLPCDMPFRLASLRLQATPPCAPGPACPSPAATGPQPRPAAAAWPSPRPRASRGATPPASMHPLYRGSPACSAAPR